MTKYQTRKFKDTFLLLWFLNVIFASILLIFANSLNQFKFNKLNNDNFKYLILFAAVILFFNSLLMITMYLGKNVDFPAHRDLALYPLEFV